MKFSVITPWLPPRPLITRAMDCINYQTHDDWQHIIMVDDPEVDFYAEYPQYRDSNRIVVNCPEWHNTFGNKCRHDAWDLVTGDIILYLDDDDILYPNCMETIQRWLEENPTYDWGYFPILKGGGIFFHSPPAGGLITGGQVFHKKTTSDGVDVRWTEQAEYCGDWEFISRCLVHLPPLLVGDLLGELPEYHHGLRYA